MKCDANGCTVARRREDRDGALERLGPLAHADQAKSRRSARLGSFLIEADAIVVDLDRYHVGVDRQRRGHPGGLAVFGDVGQSFLHDAVDRRLHRRRESAIVGACIRAIKGGHDPILCRESQSEPPKRRHDTPFVEHGRMQTVDQVANVSGGDDDRRANFAEIAQRQVTLQG